MDELRPPNNVYWVTISQSVFLGTAVRCSHGRFCVLPRTGEGWWGDPWPHMVPRPVPGQRSPDSMCQVRRMDDLRPPDIPHPNQKVQRSRCLEVAAFLPRGGGRGEVVSSPGCVGFLDKRFSRGEARGKAEEIVKNTNTHSVGSNTLAHR